MSIAQIFKKAKPLPGKRLRPSAAGREREAFLTNSLQGFKGLLVANTVENVYDT